MRGPVRRTLPSTRPVLPLDRILTDTPGKVHGLSVVNTAAVAIASDHLPLKAIVTVP